MGREEQREQLTAAIRARDVFGAEALVRADPTLPDARNSHGNTPMMLAVEERQLDLVRLFVSCGSSVHQRNHDGWTLMDSAAGPGGMEIALYLEAQGLSMEFSHRVALGDLEGMSKMLAAEPDLATRREQNRRGDAPLHSAARSSQVEAAQQLLDHGAEVGALNGHSQTPLSVTVNKGPVAGRAELASLLLAHGADPNDACGYDGVSRCLHRAITRRDVELARVLLEAGADVDARGAGDRTPLYYAVGANLEMVGVVLGFGPDLEARCLRGPRGFGGETALEQARRLKKGPMVELLEGGSHDP